jgi:hypothetical protein
LGVTREHDGGEDLQEAHDEEEGFVVCELWCGVTSCSCSLRGEGGEREGKCAYLLAETYTLSYRRLIMRGATIY